MKNGDSRIDRGKRLCQWAQSGALYQPAVIAHEIAAEERVAEWRAGTEYRRLAQEGWQLCRC